MASEGTDLPPGGGIPGPTGKELSETLERYDKSPIDESLSLFRRYGDIVALRRGPFLTVFLFHPSHARHVLVTHGSNYSRRTAPASRIEAALGKGLVTADKPAWTRMKKLSQPAFTPKALSMWMPAIERSAARLVERWSRRSRTVPLDVHSEAGVSILEIVGQMLLGESIDEPTAHEIRQAIGVAAQLDQEVPRRDALDRSLKGVSESAEREFRQRNAEFLASQAKLNSLLDVHVARRRREQSQGDLLSALIDAKDEEGNGFSDEEVRDQIKSLVVAGHDTTMTALSTTLYSLARHPELCSRVRSEIERVCRHRSVKEGDLDDLKLTRSTVLEALRLYPPVPHIDRRAEEEDTIDKYQIPKNAAIALCPYVVHRRADVWPDPEKFDPERFAEKTPEHYFPFGMGPRTCIGKNLALMEVIVFLSYILPRFDLQLVDDFALHFSSAWTMHPAGATLPLWVSPR